MSDNLLRSEPEYNSNNMSPDAGLGDDRKKMTPRNEEIVNEGAVDTLIDIFVNFVSLLILCFLAVGKMSTDIVKTWVKPAGETILQQTESAVNKGSKIIQTEKLDSRMGRSELTSRDSERLNISNLKHAVEPYYPKAFWNLGNGTYGTHNTVNSNAGITKNESTTENAQNIDVLENESRSIIDGHLGHCHYSTHLEIVPSPDIPNTSRFYLRQNVLSKLAQDASDESDDGENSSDNSSKLENHPEVTMSSRQLAQVHTQRTISRRESKKKKRRRTIESIVEGGVSLQLERSIACDTFLAFILIDSDYYYCEQKIPCENLENFDEYGNSALTSEEDEEEEDDDDNDDDAALNEYYNNFGNKYSHDNEIAMQNSGINFQNFANIETGEADNYNDVNDDSLISCEYEELEKYRSDDYGLPQRQNAGHSDIIDQIYDNLDHENLVWIAREGLMFDDPSDAPNSNFTFDEIVACNAAQFNCDNQTNLSGEGQLVQSSTSNSAQVHKLTNSSGQISEFTKAANVSPSSKPTATVLPTFVRKHFEVGKSKSPIDTLQQDPTSKYTSAAEHQRTERVGVFQPGRMGVINFEKSGQKIIVKRDAGSYGSRGQQDHVDYGTSRTIHRDDSSPRATRKYSSSNRLGRKDSHRSQTLDLSVFERHEKTATVRRESTTLKSWTDPWVYREPRFTKFQGLNRSWFKQISRRVGESKKLLNTNQSLYESSNLNSASKSSPMRRSQTLSPQRRKSLDPTLDTDINRYSDTNNWRDKLTRFSRTSSDICPSDKSYLPKYPRTDASHRPPVIRRAVNKAQRLATSGVVTGLFDRLREKTTATNFGESRISGKPISRLRRCNSMLNLP